MTIDSEKCDKWAAELRNKLVDIVQKFLSSINDQPESLNEVELTITLMHVLSTFNAQMIGSLLAADGREFMEKAVKQIGKETVKHLRQNVKKAPN